MSSDYISLVRPDDWHLHLRDGPALRTTVPHTARVFGRAIVMPNLKRPITSISDALSYRERILAVVPERSSFQPLMTLYLTDTLRLEEIDLLANTEEVVAVKYYPAGATTNSKNGVTSTEKVYPIIERMAEFGIPLLLHGESTNPSTDIFDREKEFLDLTLSPLCDRFPELKIILEHITTSDSVDFVRERNQNVAATITVHHLLYDRNDMLAKGVRPHFYCLPILKRRSHTQSLRAAATSGNPKFFLGTDSAPHAKELKENSCGCAGIYSSPAAIELYAEVFEELDALDKLEAFASFHGADFYGLARNQEEVTLQKSEWLAPPSYQLDKTSVVPIRANEAIRWKLVKDNP